VRGLDRLLGVSGEDSGRVRVSQLSSNLSHPNRRTITTMSRRYHPSTQPRNFTDWAEGEDAVQAFANACDAARLMKGIGGYEAKILGKDTFVEFVVPDYLSDDGGVRLERMILMTLVTARRIQLDDGYQQLDLWQLVEDIEDEDNPLGESVKTDSQWTAMLDLSDMVREYGAEYTHELIRVYCLIDGPCVAIPMDGKKWLFAGVVQ